VSLRVRQNVARDLDNSRRIGHLRDIGPDNPSGPMRWALRDSNREPLTLNYSITHGYANMCVLGCVHVPLHVGGDYGEFPLMPL
jgi:hypothetical protein